MSQLVDFIIEQICNYDHPDLAQHFITSTVIKNLKIMLQHIKFDIVFGFPLASIKDAWQKSLYQHLAQVLPEYTLDFTVSWQIDHHIALNLAALSQVKNIIAVASGKGGVGKSSIAVNLALALQQEGARVGLLDADIYGPSQPEILGLHKRPNIVHNKKLDPIIYNDLQVISFGLLLDKQEAIVWRGPMIAMALQQLLNDTLWNQLDYLVVDLPPGTGDIQLTLVQKAPLSGALMVTTPQDLAVQDVRRACAMFHKLKIPLFGIVENMAGYYCPKCGNCDQIFSNNGGAEMLAQEFQIPVLANFPLNRDLSTNPPIVISSPNSTYAVKYRQLARDIGAALALMPKNYSHKMPKINVVKT